MSRPLLPLVAVPVLVGLVGAGVGLATGDRADDGSTGSPGSSGSVVAATPEDLDRQAPLRPVGPAAATLPITTDGLVGAQPVLTPDDGVPDDGVPVPDATVVVPPGAVLALPLTADGTAYPADPVTGAPVDPVPAVVAEFEPREGVPAEDISNSAEVGGVIGAAPTSPIAASPSSAEPAVPGTTAPSTTPGSAPASRGIGDVDDLALADFVDPCVRAPAGCPSGLPGVVLDRFEGRVDERILPIEVSRPFAAVGPFATMCARAEADTAPDPDLYPSQRPTVAVIVSQPADLRLAGTWPDGTTIPIVPMQIDDATEEAWRADLEAGRGQGTLLACATVPRADVEAKAAGRVARLFADVSVLAGEASVTTGALVDLNVPSAADQILLAAPTVSSLGEIPDPTTGVRLPTLNVHIEHLEEVAGIPDPADPTGAPALTVVGVLTRLVTSGDCRAVADGRVSAADDVTHGYGRSGYRREVRQVAGRDAMVHVIDQAVQLDPDTPPGWQGSLCIVFRAFDSTETLAIWRVGVRAPRIPEFEVSVGIEPDFNPAWYFEVRGPCGGLLSNGIIDDGLLAGVAGRRAIACGRLNGRFLTDGIPVTIRAVDPLGIQRPWFTAYIPVNLEYCNTDDPWSAIVGGCDRSARTHVFSVDLGSPRRDGRTGNETYEVSVFVERIAAPGINRHVDPDPSHQWDVFGAPERLA